MRVGIARRVLVASVTILLAALAGLASPAADAQPPAKQARLGYLRPLMSTSTSATDAVFRQALRDLGWLLQHPKRVVALAERYRIPTIYPHFAMAEVGGLITYAPSSVELFRRAAGQVDRILRGAKPGDLPVEQPTKFEMIVNMKTAKRLGLAIPQGLLLRADRIIE